MADGLADGLADGALKHGIGLRNNAAVRRFAAWPPHAFDRQFYPVDSTPPSGRRPAPTRSSPAGWQGRLLALPTIRSEKELSRRASPRAGAATLSGRSGGSSDFSPLRYLTLAIGDRRIVGHGMGDRVPGEARPPGSFLLGKRSHALLGHWHCHSVVNVRDDTFRGEWQCSAHYHPASSVPKRYDQGRVAVRSVRSGPSGSASWCGLRPLDSQQLCRCRDVPVLGRTSLGTCLDHFRRAGPICRPGGQNPRQKPRAPQRR